ncbi:PRAME family member 12-like, partial [Echinops telfairi]|uniref:PRAME family member 12-like n=1 Tax=Echinops telfairi TaxID=9371 RepID=A0ABM1VK24_ECHTE
LDVLLARRATPQRWKLKVLDLQVNADRTFWDVWLGTHADETSSEATQPGTQTQNGHPARPGETFASLAAPVAVVFPNLCFQKTDQDELLNFLTERVTQGKDLPHLCCTKLEFGRPVPHHPIVMERILKMVQLDAVQEVEVTCKWDLDYLNWFAPYLAQMGHLQSLRLSGIRLGCRWFSSKDEVDEQLARLTSQLSRLRSLQHLILRGITFCHDHLYKLLRGLPTPLVSLGIVDGLLYFSDLTHLSLCPCLHQLRFLDLHGVCKVGLDHSFLHLLIESTSATLTHLDLGDCNIKDRDLKALQLALGHCSQLRTLLLCGNPISTVALQGLLHHTFPLCKLSLVELPVPPHCYVGPAHFLHLNRLVRAMDQLRLTLPVHKVHSLNFAHSPDSRAYDAILLHLDNGRTS